jgi:membrane-associated phospholipid phosphatase
MVCTIFFDQILLSNFIRLFRITAEDRPYWWIRETPAYSNLTRPTFRQTEQTCETAPGFPSGHVMFASTILVIVSIRMYEKVIMVEKLK